MTKAIGNRTKTMNAMIKQAVDHWRYVAPLLSRPETAEDYDTLVESLDELLDIVGDDEGHPLSSLMHQLGTLVFEYENEHMPMPDSHGISAMVFLMQQQGLTQADLSDIAPQSVISEIISGKRHLNIRHIKLLCKRFNVSSDTFF